MSDPAAMRRALTAEGGMTGDRALAEVAVGSSGARPSGRPERESHDGSADRGARALLRLGELLVADDRLSAAQLERVLVNQRSSGLRFGEVAVRLRYVKQNDVDRALAVQYGYVSGETTPSLLQGLTAAAQPHGPFAEALRGLRSQLMMRWFDGTPGQTAVAITSVDRGDGKSFICANLGVVFSQLGERTLIIDANMRQSSQHELFGIRNRMGLSAMLSGRAGFEEIVPVEHLPHLAILSAGPKPPNPLELLGRDAFRRLLETLSNRFDVILVDTPSAQQASDAQVITQRTRGALIVGRKDRTRSAEIAQLASILSGSGATILGATLNER